MSDSSFVNESMKKLSVEEREAYLSQRLREVVAVTYENVPVVKDRFDSAGLSVADIKGIRDLPKIPILKKEELVHLQQANPPFGGFLSAKAKSLKRIIVGAGPIYEPQATDRIPRQFAEVAYSCGVRAGDIVINSASYHLATAGPHGDDALSMLGCTGIPAGPGNSELQVQIMREAGVTACISFPSFLMSLIRIAEGQGYDFRRDFRLRHAILAGERLTPAMREAFEGKGIKTISFYGVAEAGLLAYECPQQSMHMFDDVIVEIVDIETGEPLGAGKTGEIVVTPLDENFPLLRYGTGDISSLATEPCSCGWTSPMLTPIVGRVGEAYRVRGQFLYALQLNQVAAKLPQMSNYQLTIEQIAGRDDLCINLELAEETADRGKLQEEFQKYFKDICRVKVDRINFVPVGTIPQDARKIVDARTSR